eukprot:5740176-Amphidinium_carterae.1
MLFPLRVSFFNQLLVGPLGLVVEGPLRNMITVFSSTHSMAQGKFDVVSRKPVLPQSCAL